MKDVDKEFREIISGLKRTNDDLFHFMRKRFPKLQNYEKKIVYNILITEKNILYSLYDIGLIKNKDFNKNFNNLFGSHIGEKECIDLFFKDFINKKEFLKALSGKETCLYPESEKYFNILNK